MTSGEDQLKNYTFGKKRNVHKFCGRCGSSVFFDPRMKEFGDSPPAPDLLGVNVSYEPFLVFGERVKLRIVRIDSNVPWCQPQGVEHYAC